MPCVLAYLPNQLAQRASAHTQDSLDFCCSNSSNFLLYNSSMGLSSFVYVCLSFFFSFFFTHCFVYTSPLARPIILYRRPYRHCIPCGTITNIHQLQLCFSTLFIFLFFVLSISSFILLLFTVFALVLMFVEFVVDEMQSVEST